MYKKGITRKAHGTDLIQKKSSERECRFRLVPEDWPGAGFGKALVKAPA